MVPLKVKNPAPFITIKEADFFAKAAISMLCPRDFHIVFMDHMMPETDGVEATKMIRKMGNKYCRDLPIIALTANAVNGVREKFINVGMNDFIAKPIELSALDRVLKTWLSRELIKIPSDSERYANDRQKNMSSVKIDAGNELFSPETGVFYTGGDMDAYAEILGVYIRKSREKQQYIQKLFDEKSWKNYIIEVHALKSTSMSIGSKLLSEQKVGIIAECVCDLPKNYLREHNIDLVFFLIETDSGIFTDTDEITEENILSYMQAGGKKSQSSAPASGVYKNVFEKKLEKYDEIILVAISSKLSRYL